MITSAILTLLYGLIKVVISPLTLLPDVVLTGNVGSAIATASDYLASVSFILPVASLVAVFGLILAVEGGILAFKGINWLIRKIPFIN